MTRPIEVLLVEDSVSDAQVVKTILSSSSLEQPRLTHAERFTDALTILATKTYDLVLLDLHLPDGEGINLIKQLKQQVPDIPIVVITGQQDEDIAAKALEEGAQDYVVKSDTFSPTRLSQIGPASIGDWLVRRIHYSIEQAKHTHREEPGKQHLTLAHQGTNEGIWDWDLKNNYIYLSRQWKSLLGLFDNAFSHTPNTWLTRIHPEDRLRFEKTLQAYLTHRQPQFYCEYRIQHVDGHYLWVLTRGQALWNEAGIAYRLTGVQCNITARKTQEHGAYQRKELAQTTLHTVGAGLLSLQATLYLNEGLYEEAEPLLNAALNIRKSLLGENHPDVGISLYNLASLYDNQFRFKEAEDLFKQSLSIFKSTLGHNHPHTEHIRTKVSLICRLNRAMEAHQQASPNSPYLPRLSTKGPSNHDL